jgi:thimet oligopeptidase
VKLFRHYAMALVCLAAAVPALAAGKPAAKPSSSKAKGAMTTSTLAVADDAPFWTGRPTAEQFAARQEARLERARQLIAQLTGVKGARTIENTLATYDAVLRELDMAASQASLIENVHPEEAHRKAAEKISQEASALSTELSLNRGVYDALAALPTEGLDEATKHYLTKTLRDFRLAGVDRDEETRKKVKALNDELVLIGQEFSRNIREDKNPITATADELAGLPADYLARHPAGPDGKITLTVDSPDAVPIFNYAQNEALRKRMYMAYNNRAYPKNQDVLKKMLAKRYELATLLGYPSWAEYVTANKMVGNAKNAQEFIDKIVAASGDRAKADYQILLARKQKDTPGAPAVNPWESAYYSELVRKSEYDFDSQKMRPYLAYAKVRDGVLGTTSKLFGVEFKKIDAPVWHPTVDAYEMWDDGKLAGRFYLDMHPRKDKYNHAAQFDVRTGIAGRQIPEATLVCNFPGGEANDPGLMEFSDVRTYFHEFGHLIHTLFAGHQKWVGIGGIRTEHDFVEAPSQLLEEWVMDAKVLQTFAKHHETGEPIPAELVAQMKRASEFGKGLGVRRQMVFANTSLSYYDRAPDQVDLDGVIQEYTKKYQPFPFVEGTHFQTAFGHLDGYSAVYYTYMWSLVIAKDLWSAFDKSDLLNPAIPTKYRNTVLAPGGSKPAAQLVQDFLGRPFDFESYRRWLNEDATAAPAAVAPAGGR